MSNQMRLRTTAIELLAKAYEAKDCADSETDSKVSNYCIRTIMDIMDDESNENEVKATLETIDSILNFMA